MLAITLNGVRRELPTCWEEAGELAWPMLRELSRYPGGEGKNRAMRILLGMRNRDWLNVDENQLVALATGLPWLSLTPIKRCFREEVYYRGKTYRMPPKAAHGFTALEYTLAEEYYEAFIEGDDGTAIANLTALLLRPVKRGQRLPITDRDQVEKAAKKLRKLNPEWAAQAVMYWAGVKEWVYETYGNWLFKQPAEGEEEQSPSGINLKWWGVWMDIAETGTFGPLNDVHQADFHNLCLWLIKKKEQEAQRARQAEIQHAQQNAPA